MKEKVNSLELLYNDGDIIDEDNRYEVESFGSKNQIIMKTKKKSNNIPIIFWTFIFSLIGLLIFICIYIIKYLNYKIKYKAFNEPFLKPNVTEYKYKLIKFDNGLELLLVQVDENHKAGGAIVIDSGYNDLTFEKGELKSSLYGLISKDFYDSYILEVYFGNFDYYVNDTFSYFRFDVLNDYFFSYLKDFSLVLKINSSITKIFNNNQLHAKKKIDNEYTKETKKMDKREQYLIDYLIYGLNENGKDVYRPGRQKDFPTKNIGEFVKNNVTKVLNNLIKPSRIKIVLMSHFKMSRMEAKFKNYFKYLIKLNKNEQSSLTDEFKYNNDDFKKQKIIIYNINESETSYIKINYYIEKIDNESYSDFIINSGYFNYLKYMLDGNKEALCDCLDLKDFDFKSLSTDFEVILKTKIKFSIKIELYSKNSYFQDILYNIYHYIYKISKSIEKISKEDERYNEIKKILNQSFIFQEDLNNPIETSYNLALNLFKKINNENCSSYFLKNNWIPSLDSDNDLYKFKKYYEQLIPNNSVIIFGKNGKEKYKETCKSDHKFSLNCEKLFVNKPKQTKYLFLKYIVDDLNVNFTKYFENNEKSYINFKKNEYISDYLDLIPKDPEDKNNDDLAYRIGNISNMRNFYFKKDTSFGIPKVHVSLNFFHPYLRPGDYFSNAYLINNNSDEQKQIKYFLIMLYWTYIKKEIQENLNDAIRAGNSIVVSYNDNNLYIRIFAYSDKIETILEKIKNIITNTTNLENGEFKNKAELYKESLFEDYLNFKNANYTTITLFYFYNILVNEKMFNRYKFFQEFNELIFNNSIKEITNGFGKIITNFIINAHIFGNCTKEGAEKIADLFKENNGDELNFDYVLQLAGYDKEKDGISAFNFVNHIRNINDLNENKNIRIDNIDVDNDNKTLITYFYYKKYNLNNYINYYLLSKILQGHGNNEWAGYEVQTEGLLRNATYFRFTLTRTKINENTTYDFSKFLYVIKKTLTRKLNVYKVKVDILGDKFYYIQKNMEKILLKKRDDMYKTAIDYLNSLVYTSYKEGPIKKIMKEIKLDGLVKELNNSLIDINPRVNFLRDPVYK